MTATRSVVLAMTVSVLIFGVAHGLQYVNEERGRRIANPLPELGGFEMLVAWGTMLTFLIILADIPATGDLAASFAYLILLAILYTYGIAAFTNLGGLMGRGMGAEYMPDSGGTNVSSGTGGQHIGPTPV